jgi:hypothetical protein
MNRRTELLLAAADALDAGEDPLSGGFLSEHDVTSDECIALARQLAIGARVVAAGLNKPRSPQGMGVMMAMAEDL